MDQVESRKAFLKRCTYAIPSLVGIGLLAAGCNSGEPGKNTDSNANNNNAAPKSCDDFSGVSDNDLKTRKNFNYVDVSPDKNKMCKKCNLHIPAKPGVECGGCMLFKGPVKDTGTCTYWAPKVESSAS